MTQHEAQQDQDRRRTCNNQHYRWIALDDDVETWSETQSSELRITAGRWMCGTLRRQRHTVLGNSQDAGTMPSCSWHSSN